MAARESEMSDINLTLKRIEHRLDDLYEWKNKMNQTPTHDDNACELDLQDNTDNLSHAKKGLSFTFMGSYNFL